MFSLTFDTDVERVVARIELLVKELQNSLVTNGAQYQEVMAKGIRQNLTELGRGNGVLAYGGDSIKWPGLGGKAKGERKALGIGPEYPMLSGAPTTAESKFFQAYSPGTWSATTGSGTLKPAGFMLDKFILEHQTGDPNAKREYRTILPGRIYAGVPTRPFVFWTWGMVIGVREIVNTTFEASLMVK